MGAIVLMGMLAQAQTTAPYYTQASIANTAAAVANYYAPNTLVTVYGVNLAFVTAALTVDEIAGGMLPTALPGTGVRVLINSLLADIYYVSPGQINLLIPNYLTAGPATFQVEVDGLAGPAIPITLSPVAPAMYEIGGSATISATHLNGQTVTADSPAQPGEEVVLYATGLGPTLPQQLPNQLPAAAATLATPGFQVCLNGTPVDPSLILYAGVTPGYAGLYQVNVVLPADAPQNPELQIGWSGQMSPPQLYLPVQ